MSGSDTSHGANAPDAPEPLASTPPVGADVPLSHSDEAYQKSILPGVSRTFALTIPQLPTGLERAVTNAYLLCRIADTIEDDAALTAEQKSAFHSQFVDVISGRSPGTEFGPVVAPLLSPKTLDAEIELVRNTDRVVRVTHSMNRSQRTALTRCVTIMCQGMPRFQRDRSIGGLPRLGDLNDYCYYVAGVVGEMLTELFCDHSTQIAKRGDSMRNLAVSFGQGLQMTNILKDIWEDRRNNTCWLPQDVFSEFGFNLQEMRPGMSHEGFQNGMNKLIGIAHRHLSNALEYTLHLPRPETGVRRFCLWAVGLAILSLRNLHDHPEFSTGQEVKVSRATVRRTVLITSAAARSNSLLRMLFRSAARGLPLAPDGPPIQAPAPG